MKRLLHHVLWIEYEEGRVVLGFILREEEFLVLYQSLVFVQQDIKLWEPRDSVPDDQVPSSGRVYEVFTAIETPSSPAEHHAFKGLIIFLVHLIVIFIVQIVQCLMLVLLCS